MQHNNQTGHQKRRGIDIVMLIVMTLLVIVFALEIPTLSESLAHSGQTMGVPIITELMPCNKGTITDADGTYCDWIELYNPTGQTINLAGFALTDNPQMPTKCVLPYRVLKPGEYAVVYADGRPSTSSELHASFKLKNADEIVMLVGTDGAEIQRVEYPAMETDQSYALNMNTLEWAPVGECTPGFPNTGSGYAAYRQSRRAVSPLTINEVMAGNTITLRDEDGDYPDWVELYNPSEETIDLTGWGLSDTETRPKGWEFPAAEIGPGEYLIVFLSGKNRTDAGKELHTNFKLKNDGESVYLSNLRGQIMSEVYIDGLKDDLSYALVPGTERWQVYTQPTPGYPNTADGWNAFQESLYSDMDSPVVISEVMSSNVSTLQDQFGAYPDWFELYNRSDRDVNLSGWGLTDDTDAMGRWTFPSLVLKPGEYLTVFASGRDSIDSKKKLHTDFSLGAEGDIVILNDPEDRVADRCYVPPLRAGLSYQRQPGSTCFVFCGQPTPGTSNADGYSDMAAEPFFSIKAGLYDAAQQVALASPDPDARIYYTLDGTVPNEAGPRYTAPIQVDQTAAVRAVACREGYLPSNTACATYIIGEDIGLPVVSIVTDPDNLFDEETGIYANGPGWTSRTPHRGANFWKDWERPAHLELLEPDGTVAISQDIGIKIFGNHSRAKDKKSFALMSRTEYGNDTFDYPVFPELPYTSYKDLIIRSSQDGNMSLIRGQLQIGLALENSNVDGQAHRQSILFVNGEFWGVYDLMEKLNEHFLAQHHGVDPDKIDMLESNGDVILGSNEDYLALIQYVKTHDLSIQENYDYVASRIDIDNYIDWCAIEIYVACEDLGIKYWRPRTPGGKWRWILYDLDWGFYHLYQEKYAERLDFFSFFLNSEGTGNEYGNDNTLIRELLENEGFKQKFIERFVYHCTVTYAPDKVLQWIDELAANIEPFVQRDRDRWPGGMGGTVESWKELDLQLVRDFAVERPGINLYYMQQYFGLTDAEMEKLMQQEAGNE